nr:hypothetical protein JVH1_8060 [Rhodococcus sp. JVH1]
MPTSPFIVPTVDISPYLAEGARAHNSAECARVAAELDTACREVGFVQIVGHRIPERRSTASPVRSTNSSDSRS